MDWLSLLGIVVFLIIGVAIILFIAKIIWFLLPAAFVGVVVFFLSSYNLYWTGVAFVVVAILSLLIRLKKR
jgi:membrane protein implicated in regulation of membrane protease activity